MNQDFRHKSPPLWHSLTPEEVAARLGSSREGLSSQEAAARHLEGRGNGWPAPARRGWGALFWKQLQGVISLLLAGVGCVAIVAGHPLDGAVLLGVVLLNAAIGAFHEFRADCSIEKLRGLCTSLCRVVRDGRTEWIPSESLVEGDLIELEPGQRVPADVRIVESHHLLCLESALTGESLAEEKSPESGAADQPIGDQRGMAFAGTEVCAGSGRGLVVEVGTRTVMGRLGVLMAQITEVKTPLLHQLDRLAKWLTGAILLVACATFLYGLWVHAMGTSELFLTSVTLAAAAIPEGLSAALTIALGVGASRMAQRQAIVRRLPVVEALGAVTTICSDKTGTLTTSQMTVEEVITRSGVFRATGSGWDPAGKFEALHTAPQQELVQACQGALLCNCGDVRQTESGEWKPWGDPTEVALVVAARKAGLSTDLRAQQPRLFTLPFSHERPLMATVHRTPEGKVVLWVKGSPELLLERSLLSAHEHAAWREQQKRCSEAGLRLIAVGYRELEVYPESSLQLEPLCQKLHFLALMAMSDPPHPTVAASIALCQQAGIQLKMVTGDHLHTALALAAQIGLIPREQACAITGKEWRATPRHLWKELAQRAHIFARTDPAQKLEIVQALQEGGEVVAMTGDGVNDAPALKRAEVGIACGAGCADAAKEAASIVLTNGQFDAIAHAVAEGRTIFENIQKVIMFLLTSGLSEAGLVASGIFLGGALPILPIQILWTNLITTVVLALGLALGERHPSIMRRPPRSPAASLIPHDLKARMGWGTLLGALFPLLFFDWAIDQGRSLEEARSLCMTVLLMGEIALMFSLRSLHDSRWDSWRGFFSDRSWIGALIVVGLQLLLLYVPALQALFHLTPLSLSDWFAIGACWGCQMVSFEWLKGWSGVPLADPAYHLAEVPLLSENEDRSRVCSDPAPHDLPKASSDQ